MPAIEKRKISESITHSAWYVEAMERLVGVVQDLSHAHDVNAVSAIVRDAARELTGADGATFVLRDNGNCYYADENAIAPLWKGKRFPMSQCISGWVMLNARSAIIEDIYSDSRIPADAYRPTFVKSLAMVPIRRNNPIGAIGNYWANNRKPSEEEVAILQALADTTSVALENSELYGKLQQQVDTLQKQQTRIHEQCAALEIFTRALAHDLKEPARALMSFSKILREKQTDADKQQKYFQFIQESSNRMGMLLDTVFHYTQLDDQNRITKESCVMAEVVKTAQENIAQLIKDHDATIKSETLPKIQANPKLMVQVMQHLIANAIGHNESKVTINISVEEQDGNWLFSVSDNGAGIASEHLEKIFLPFKRLTNNYECAGMGLAICRKIITSYGGKIWCESKPGNGTTFLFTIPK